MFATLILCVFIMLVVPAVTAQTGYLRLRRCAEMDTERGYRTALSLSSPEAWAYAQRASGPRYLITGLVMAALSVLVAVFLPTDSPLTMFIFTGPIVLFQAAAVIVLISSVESGLRALWRKGGRVTPLNTEI